MYDKSFQVCTAPTLDLKMANIMIPTLESIEWPTIPI
jgi:hypothetical protein